MYEKSELKRRRLRRLRCRCCSWPVKKEYNTKLSEVFTFYIPIKEHIKNIPFFSLTDKIYAYVTLHGIQATENLFRELLLVLKCVCTASVCIQVEGRSSLVSISPNIIAI